MRQIYLDHNATTPVAPAVWRAMRPYLRGHFGNPSSSHMIGRIAHDAVDQARQQLAESLGASPHEIIFTSGGTESNNLALKGVLGHAQRPAHLVISAIEHPAITEPSRYLQSGGVSLSIVPCDRTGRIDPQEVQAALRPETRLVSIMHANNETGTIQPIAPISRICRRHGALLHCDAAQSLGKIPVDVKGLGVDLLTIAGHKVYAPKGVGVLFVRQGVSLQPIMHGAGHESGLRAGTENVPYIVGLAAATALAVGRLDLHREQMSQLRDQLWHRLQEGIPHFKIHGELEHCLPNTLSACFPNVPGRAILDRTPEICASLGAACHAESTAMSATLRAMQVPLEQARGTIRLSLGWGTTAAEIDRAADLLIEAWRSQV